MSKRSRNRGRSLDHKSGARPQNPADLIAAAHTETTQWSGPLPPPAYLEHFDSVIPGGAARILKMAEEEQGHRISFEGRALAAAVADKRRGQYLGGSIGLAGIVGAVVVAVLGGPWQVSVALVGVPVLGMIQAVIGNAGKGKKE